MRADYLASNTYRAQAGAAALARLPAAYRAVYQPLLDARPEYLAAGFDEVEVRYGTFDACLEGLGVDAEELRRSLLVG